MIRQRSAGSGLYTEGAVAFVEIRDTGGALVDELQTPDYLSAAELLRLQLAPGRYEVRSCVRPCEAACPAMDTPTDACTISLAVEPAKTVAVMIERRVGAPCIASTVAP